MSVNCDKCGKPMIEQDTWTDVHHYVCFECHTEKTPVRQNWLQRFVKALKFDPRQKVDAKLMAKAISNALTAAEVQKYATPESQFTFELQDATEEDLRIIRDHLTPFENSLVKIIIIK